MLKAIRQAWEPVRIYHGTRNLQVTTFLVAALGVTTLVMFVQMGAMKSQLKNFADIYDGLYSCHARIGDLSKDKLQGGAVSKGAMGPIQSCILSLKNFYFNVDQISTKEMAVYEEQFTKIKILLASMQKRGQSRASLQETGRQLNKIFGELSLEMDLHQQRFLHKFEAQRKMLLGVMLLLGIASLMLLWGQHIFFQGLSFKKNLEAQGSLENEEETLKRLLIFHDLEHILEFWQNKRKISHQSSSTAELIGAHSVNVLNFNSSQSISILDLCSKIISKYSEVIFRKQIIVDLNTPDIYLSKAKIERGKMNEALDAIMSWVIHEEHENKISKILFRTTKFGDSMVFQFNLYPLKFDERKLIPRNGFENDYLDGLDLLTRVKTFAEGGAMKLNFDNTFELSGEKFARVSLLVFDAKISAENNSPSYKERRMVTGPSF